MRNSLFDTDRGLTIAVTGMVLALGLFGALIAGYGAAKGNLIMGAAAVGLVGGILLSFFPVVILWLALVVGLVASGLAKLYLPAMAEIRWLMVPVGLVLVAHVLLRQLSDRRLHPGISSGIAPILWWAAAVLAVSLLATLVNSPEAMQVVRGLKGYFQAWGVLLALALLSWPDDLMRRQLPKALLVLGLLQLPFVLHQYLVLVPQRETMAIDGLVAVDVIAGTFGAQFDGGGANSMLAAFMFIVLAGLIGLWQKGQLSGRVLAVLGLLLMSPMLVNGAKVSLVYALVLFVVLFARDALANPGRFFAGGLVLGSLLAAMLVAYSVGLDNKRVDAWSDVVVDIFHSNVSAEHQARGTFTRAGALRYWAEQHIPGDPFGAVLGHGLYQSRHDSAGVDLWNSSDPGLGIKNTAVSAILWDAGLLGVAVVFGFVASGYRTAGRLARRFAADPWMSGLFLGAKAGMAIVFVSLWVKSYFSYQLAYQTLLVALLGWLVYWDRRLPDEPAVPGQQADPNTTAEKFDKQVEGRKFGTG